MSHYCLDGTSLDTLCTTTSHIPEGTVDESVTFKMSDYDFCEEGELTYIKSAQNANTWGKLLTTAYKYQGQVVPLADKNTTPSPIYKNKTFIYFPTEDANRNCTTTNGVMRRVGSLGSTAFADNLAVIIPASTLFIYYNDNEQTIYFKFEEYDAESPANWNTYTESVKAASPHIFLYIQALGGSSGKSISYDWVNSSPCHAFGGGGGSGAFGALSVDISKFSESSPLVIKQVPSGAEGVPATRSNGTIEVHCNGELILTLTKGEDGGNAGYGSGSYDFNDSSNYYAGTGGAGGTATVHKESIDGTICIVDALNGTSGGNGGVCRYPNYIYAPTSGLANLNKHTVALIIDNTNQAKVSINKAAYTQSTTNHKAPSGYLLTRYKENSYGKMEAFTVDCVGRGGCSLMNTAFMSNVNAPTYGCGAFSKLPRAEASMDTGILYSSRRSGGPNCVWCCYVPASD